MIFSWTPIDTPDKRGHRGRSQKWRGLQVDQRRYQTRDHLIALGVGSCVASSPWSTLPPACEPHRRTCDLRRLAARSVNVQSSSCRARSSSRILTARRLSPRSSDRSRLCWSHWRSHASCREEEELVQCQLFAAGLVINLLHLWFLRQKLSEKRRVLNSIDVVQSGVVQDKERRRVVIVGIRPLDLHLLISYIGRHRSPQSGQHRNKRGSWQILWRVFRSRCCRPGSKCPRVNRSQVHEPLPRWWAAHRCLELFQMIADRWSWWFCRQQSKADRRYRRIALCGWLLAETADADSVALFEATGRLVMNDAIFVANNWLFSGFTILKKKSNIWAIWL